MATQETAQELVEQITEDVTEAAIRKNEATCQVTKPKLFRRHSYGK